ncbi:hypothetical protein MMC07_006398 [Pseudocyphellaria aurata]|nr:hypothetical protein [Pseudocyphellaria aurata]
MDPPQTPAQADGPEPDFDHSGSYHDHRQRLMRDALRSRLDAFCQQVQSQSDSVTIPADFATLDAFLSRLESETSGPRQESSWVYDQIGRDPDSVEELVARLRRHPEELSPYINPLNTDPGQFLVGSVLFAYFMRVANENRRGNPAATLTAFLDSARDFAADVACWDRFILFEFVREQMLRQELDRLRRLSPADAADALVATLPAVDAPEEQSCPICMEPYADDDAAEPAVRLPCRHVLGGDCFAAWILTGTVTCPLCRAPVIGTATATAIASSNEVS